MVYVTVCLGIALFKIKEHENDCVRYKDTMQRKAEGGGF
jgi:hypothetical protein